MGSKSNEIKHRLNQLGNGIKLNAVERSRKLKSLQVTKGKIQSRLSSLRKQRKEIDIEINEAENQFEQVEVEFERLYEEKSPIITEHCYLRYAERFMGLDLLKIHEEILKLPQEDVYKSGDTIVTCFTDDNDHFNLAEREKL